MLTSRGIRVALSVAVIALTGVASGAIGLSGAGGATTPKVVVTPATNLHNGEAVKITGKGFVPGDSVYIVECQVKATGEAGCDISTLKGPFTISSTGALPTFHFHVITGTVGSGKCGTAASNLKNCAVSVGTEAGTDSAVGKIAFKSLAKKKG